MFGDIGWAELMLIGIVALIVIGPEDLPQMFRQVGRFTAKLRAMSRDFSRAMEQAAKESGVKDVTDNFKGATSATSLGLNKVKQAADRFEKWDPIKTAAASNVVKPIVPPPMPATPATPLASVDVLTATDPKIYGAETSALLRKQAAKKTVLMQTAQKLKAIQAGEDDSVAEVSVPTQRSAKAKPAAKSVEAATIPQPKVARKPKKADQA